MKIKLKMFKMFNKEMFDFGYYSSKPIYYDDSKALVVVKIKDSMSGIAIKQLVVLKPKLYLILVTDSSEFKKAKSINKNVIAKTSNNQYKHVLLNKKYLNHAMNRIQSKN